MIKRVTINLIRQPNATSWAVSSGQLRIIGATGILDAILIQGNAVRRKQVTHTFLLSCLLVSWYRFILAPIFWSVRMFTSLLCSLTLNCQPKYVLSVSQQFSTVLFISRGSLEPWSMINNSSIHTSINTLKRKEKKRRQKTKKFNK